MSPSGKSRASKLSLAVAAVAFWYIFLCLVHWSQTRPLWNDEAAVFRSVELFSPAEMFNRPLLAFQVFPRVYLFLIQQFSSLFDFHLLSLRFFSLVCMTAGFILWMQIARQSIKDPWQYCAFVMSWPASGLLLYYSSELKQYSMDVLVAAVFILFLLHQKDWHRQKHKGYVPALAALPVLGLFSYPGFILAMLVLYNLAVYTVRDRSNFRYCAVFVASLAATVVLSYIIDMRHRELWVLNKGFGDYFISFSSPESFFQTLGEGTNNLFSRWFVEKPRYFKSLTRVFTGFGLIYMFAGYFQNRKKEGDLLHSMDVIGLALFVVMLVMGCLRKYPFTVPRTSLYYAPVVIYMTLRGMELASRIHPFLYRFFLGLYFVFLGFLIVMQSKLAFAGKLSYYPILWGT